MMYGDVSLIYDDLRVIYDDLPMKMDEHGDVPRQNF